MLYCPFGFFSQFLVSRGSDFRVVLIAFLLFLCLPGRVTLSVSDRCTYGVKAFGEYHVFVLLFPWEPTP